MKAVVKWNTAFCRLFPLIFMFFRGSEKSVTKLQFHCYHLHDRVGRINYLLLAERLLQEYVCVSFATVESLRLQFARHNQDVLRTEVLSNLQDAVSSEVDTRAGKRVICPRSIHNSFRHRFSR